MYSNISSKIKVSAIVIFIVEAIAAIAGGIEIISYDDDMTVTGIIIMVVGFLIALVFSWLIYGFGVLIEKASNIERNTCRFKGQSVAQTKEEQERINKLEKIRAQGLISEIEYQQVIAKHQ